MNGHDLQFEIFGISKSICPFTQGFSFVVRPFDDAGRNRIIIMGQDLLEVFSNGFGKIL